MKSIVKRLLALVLCLFVFVSLAPAADADMILIMSKPAQDLSEDLEITGTGYSKFGFLKDGKTKTYQRSKEDAVITLSHPEGIAKLYLMFDLEFGAYTVTNDATGQSVTAGTYGFLHELVDLEAAFGEKPTSVTLNFAGGQVRLSEIFAFSEGTLPEFVQTWEAPLEGCADLVLFATHGDDDQLYFAGLLPYYAGELKYNVQVVYMTDHRNLTKERTHEMLNGLWSVGVRAYPVFGSFADFRKDDKDATYRIYKNSYDTSKEDLLSYVVEQVRRFKPLVAVGHDPKGEYGHGMHMVYSELLQESVTAANDPAQFPESADKYGVWEPKKVYLHLYEENPIVMDYDRPLESFGGMTAFQVTQELGFPCHETQYDYFKGWLYGGGKITLASQIKKYNPCKFGLYFTSVGADVQKNDFFENVLTRDQQEQQRLEQERLEAERLAAEEAARLEAERLAAEEAARLEAERLAAEEAARLEAERQEMERLAVQQLAQRKQMLFGAYGAAIAVLTAVLILLLIKRRK